MSLFRKQIFTPGGGLFRFPSTTEPVSEVTPGRLAAPDSPLNELVPLGAGQSAVLQTGNKTLSLSSYQSLSHLTGSKLRKMFSNISSNSRANNSLIILVSDWAPPMVRPQSHSS